MTTDIRLNLDGYTDIPEGKIAAVVTHLEMTALPALQPPGGLRLRRVAEPAVDWYRALYRAIGEDWLWFSRIAMADERLAGLLGEATRETYVADAGTPEIGLAELSFREPGAAEIAFFGLKPTAVGQGLGAAMMAETLRLAWRDGITRVWLHTCTLDHPRALGFYRHQGFVPYRRRIEVVDDPRLTGILPRTAAAHVPVIGTSCPGPASR